MSAALEPGTPTLAARLERIAVHGAGRARYTPLGEVAQGGMGRILRAWDERLSREVAMKVVARAAPEDAREEERADHERRLARFIDEARITGQLDHPGIVPVYEIGLDEDGAVFFTMPLVRGQDLKRVFALVHRGEDGWTLQRAVDVMHTVCLTVAFAHSKGVVHRDLKPENVMVGRFGEAYVLDWGLALLLGRAEKTGIVGTPAYMSPEQAAGNGAEVGPRSDVYSLGAILYELFARRMPHELSLETRGGEHDSLERVLATPPRPLSELGEDVPPELAAICAKAMAADPRERYASALEMAGDLAAWLAGRVVSVHDRGRWTRLRKWRARNRGLAFALDALLALLVAGVAGFFWQQKTWLVEVQAKHAEVRVSAYAAGLSAADLGLRAHESGESRRRLAECDDELRGWEWRHLALRADASTRVLAGHGGGVRAVAVSPDGARLASGSDDGTVRLWDAHDGACLAELAGHSGVVKAIAFSPDGARLASASRDKSVLVWDVARAALAGAIAAHEADVVALAFACDGSVLVSGDVYGSLVASALPDGEILALLRPETKDGVVALDVLSETGEIAAVYLSGTLRVLGPHALELRREARVARRTPTALDADPHGCLLAVGFERTALVLDATTLAPLRALDEHGSAVSGVAFAPGSEQLATTSYDNVLRVWELATGRTLAELDGHDSDVSGVSFFPDGRRLATSSEDHTLRLWDLERAPVSVLAERRKWVDALAFAPDGASLAAGARDDQLRVYDVRSGAELAVLATEGVVDCVAWSARGELAFGCGGAGPRLAASADLGGARALAAGTGFPKTLLFDPSGARLFTRDSDGRVGVYEPARDQRIATLETDDGEPGGVPSASLALSRDGHWLAAGTARGEVLLWDARTLARRAAWKPGEASVTALAFSPDGARLAVGRQNRSIALLSTRHGTLERTLDGHENIVACLAFSPDGERLVSGAYDHTLRVWSPDDDLALLTLHGHAGPVLAVAFDPAGEILASASKDGTVRLWRTARAFGSAHERARPQSLDPK